MTNNDNDLSYIEDDDEESGFRRWMSFVVVLFAIGGFFALAWYAYHAGTKTVNSEDVPLIEADASPLKEAPADPGGQQFPHQDKTVYDAISGGQSDQQTAERVLPAPEEPVQRIENATAAANESNTPNAAAMPESSATKETAATGASQATGAEEVPTIKTYQVGDSKVIQIGETAKGTAAPVPEVKVADMDAHGNLKEKPAAAPAKQVAAAPAPAKAKAKTVDIASTENAKKLAAVSPAAGDAKGAGMVQLGAYRSDSEAKASWSKMLKANNSLLSGKDYVVKKADLGAKGTYYRLRVVNLANAKQFCQNLTANGQQCMVVK